jgi:hypothetical protein
MARRNFVTCAEHGNKPAWIICEHLNALSPGMVKAMADKSKIQFDLNARAVLCSSCMSVGLSTLEEDPAAHLYEECEGCVVAAWLPKDGPNKGGNW